MTARISAPAVVSVRAFDNKVCAVFFLFFIFCKATSGDQKRCMGAGKEGTFIIGGLCWLFALIQNVVAMLTASADCQENTRAKISSHVVS